MTRIGRMNADQYKSYLENQRKSAQSASSAFYLFSLFWKGYS